MSTKVKIAIDAMGGIGSPSKVINAIDISLNCSSAFSSSFQNKCFNEITQQIYFVNTS